MGVGEGEGALEERLGAERARNGQNAKTSRS